MADLEADLDQVLDATDVGILLLGDDGTIRRFSRACTRFLDLTDADVGRPFQPTGAHFDPAELVAAIERASGASTPSRFHTAPTADFDRTLLIDVRPYPSVDGADQVSIRLVDETGGHDRDQELAQLADRLAHALNESGVVLWECTIDMEPVWASENFEEIVGFTRQEWERFPFIDNLHPDDVERLDAYLTRQNARLRRGEDVPPSEIDYRYRADDGSYRTVNARMLATDQDGRTVVRGRNMDVTEERAREAKQNELNDELARLNRSLSEFTQMVSHDLRAPLRHVTALVGFLREDVGEALSDEVELRLTQIEERVQAMAGLIEDLLEYARSGTSRTEAQTADLQTLVNDTVDLVSNRGGIEISIESDVGPIRTNTVPLASCIRNLIDNAVKHHPGPEGRVTIRAWIEGDDLLVTVADDGEGIDPINHRRIFEPMQSLGQGTGLGLSTIAKILDERNGSITLDSELGRGAAFTITWPLGPGDDDRPGVRPSSRPRASRSRRVRSAR